MTSAAAVLAGLSLEVPVADRAPDTCCGATACCTPDGQALDPARTPAEAKAAAGCTCGS